LKLLSPSREFGKGRKALRAREEQGKGGGKKEGSTSVPSPPATPVAGHDVVPHHHETEGE
ncbi:hypothetical protein U1Q18_036533, partial [Sarracenia purpurea var. burkii]